MKRTTLVLSAALVASALLPVTTAQADASSVTPWRTESATKTASDFVLGTAPGGTVRSSTEAAAYDVRVLARDRTGAAVLPAAAMLIDLESGAGMPWRADGEGIVATVPEGSYSLIAIVRTGTWQNPSDFTVYADPELELGSDVTLDVDARRAQEFTAVTPSPKAETANKRIAFWQEIAGRAVKTSVNGDGETTLRGFPSEPTDRPFYSMYMDAKTEPLNVAGTPKAYFLGFPVKGRVPASLRYTARAEDLARVRNRLAVQGDPVVESAARHEFMWFEEVPGEPWYGLVVPVRAPAVQDIYYTARNMSWRGEFSYKPEGKSNIAEIQEAPRTFRAGRTYNESWDKPAFGPTADIVHNDRQMIPIWSPADTGQPGLGNLGGNSPQDVTGGGLVLRRDGLDLEAQNAGPFGGQWNTPAEEGRFEFEATMTRDGSRSPYATRIDGRWAFTSSGVAGSARHRLLQVRATGSFDLHGRARANTLFPLDVRLERPPGGTAARSLVVRASYDDGESWTRVPLIPTGTDRWTALVRHPRHHNGFVSLRIGAGDRSGNAVDQTVIRAYGLTG